MGSDSIDLLTEAYLYQGEVNPVFALNNQGEVIAQHVYTSRVGGQRLANKSIESDPMILHELCISSINPIPTPHHQKAHSHPIL
jgi:hypothetical protein